MRKIRSDSITGYSGVRLDNRTDRYQAQANLTPGRATSLGTFDSAEEAATVVNECYIKHGMTAPNKLSAETMRHVTQLRITRRANALQSKREREMKIPKIKGVHGPEYKIQERIIKYLEDRGWFVKILTGTMYQWGLSDLLISHTRYGIKLVEVKNPEKFSFTAAQLSEFPKFIANGAPIYILTAANAENYNRLFGKSNYWLYLSGIAER